ncbi:hypothetical protein [Amycolatopsis sp. FDAARGOS 1241]|uniref:hypothetical protein n=1 Tax=Amycolatopsis sp. FDAARGOS 1241 TaxID=2778070 RepID=UPI001950AE69|nr:hypothetical protein [Amycolatopsis sp. FDAARGOS 1241]QRP42781.1 hypothetical protein I6J71_25225 [Amycolatopsis sp. FDAARGOS 1241]
MTKSTVCPVAPADLPQHAKLLANGYRVALVAEYDDGEALRAVYLFSAAAPDRRMELHVPLPKADPQVPTLAR